MGTFNGIGAAKIRIFGLGICGNQSRKMRTHFARFLLVMKGNGIGSNTLSLLDIYISWIKLIAELKTLKSNNFS
jgi:hypothetical protein